MTNYDQLLSIVEEILLRDWDPIGVNTYEQAWDEYNSYAPGVVRMLLTGADEDKLATYLSYCQRVSMGMSRIDEELHRRVARRLLEHVANL